MENETIEKLLNGMAAGLEEKEIPIHTLIAAQGGSIFFERYWFPFDKDRTHRMFSVTKSLTSIAVGFLAVEGRLQLSDPVIAYFPEYNSKTISPWIRSMTIKDLLTMQTCHFRTTYKIYPDRNWVESFFTIPPTNRSGEVFQYDTSSAHTLAALVKRLTGRKVLDYLRNVCPEGFSFSVDAHIICDPFGSEIGGSGLVCRPIDLMNVGLWIRKELKAYLGMSKQNLFQRLDERVDAVEEQIHNIGTYLFHAVSFHVPTIHFGQTLEERMGYGYQFWRIRGGFAMYGMGGQYLLFFPDQDLILLTCADTQNLKGGNQILLNSIYSNLKWFPGFSKSVEKSKSLLTTNQQTAKFSGHFTFNNAVLTETDLYINGNIGSFAIKTERGRTMIIPFDFTCIIKRQVMDPEENNKALTAVVSAHLVRQNEIYIETDFISEEMGWFIVDARFSDQAITLYIRTKVEGKYTNWSGIYEGFSEKKSF
jgi:CubicO group peptidase (beta-lactamase class C family)